MPLLRLPRLGSVSLKHARLSLISAALALVAGSPLGATQTDNYGIHAVPVSGKIAVDGKLNDWDLTGGILMCYDLETLRDKYSATVSAMYDAENLYIAVQWKDDAPLGNSHDPKFQAVKGWAGDSIQMRIKTDRISHVTAWYYEAGKAPAILIDYGVGVEKPFGGGGTQLFHTEGWKLQQGAEMAFLKDADGKGYVQEIKLPWALITQDKKYAAGESFRMGIELLWGEADWPAHRYADNLSEGASSREFFFTAHNNWGKITLEPKGGLKLPEPAYMAAYRKAMEGETLEGPVEIRYELPKDARVTLAIDDAEGRRVRNLLPAAARKAGKNVERWDGLNDAGKPVEPGEYRFKIISHDGIHASYTMSFANPGNPSWRTPDGRGGFYGDHTAPMAAAAGGNYAALATPMGEAGPHLMGLNLDGQKLWDLPNRTAFDGGQISLATDGKILWVANEGKEATIYRVQVATGKYAPWNATVKDAAGVESAVLDLKVTEAPGIITKRSLGINLKAIALYQGKLAVCLMRENRVKILDSDTGKVEAEFEVAAPAAVTHAGKGWLVLSQGKLLRLGTDGKTTSFADGDYADGYGLATDADGAVYLSVRGAQQNVLVFSPEGKVVREIGQKGGRPVNGKYLPSGMRNPAQIAVDTKGRLWVAESTENPKRSSLWDTKTGALLRDYAGTTGYAVAGSINPFDPTVGFSGDTVYRIDLEKGGYEPTYSLGKSGDPDQLFPPTVHHSTTSKTVLYQGKTYVFSPGEGGSSTISCIYWDGKDWRSVANLGVVPDLTKTKPGNKKQGIYQHPVFEGHSNEWYSWADANGDGLVQAAEMKFSKPELNGQPAKIRSYLWGRLPDDDGALTFMIEKAPDVLWRLAITSVTAAGAPVYDVTKPEVIKVERPVIGGGNGQGMTIGGSNGRTYLNQDPIVAIDRDGKVQGGYPSKNIGVHGSHNARAAKPGYIIGPSSILGVAAMGKDIGDVFYIGANLGENYLFTEDTLYIQTLFKDTRGVFENPAKAVKGMPMDNTTAGGESFGGNFVRTKDGKCYVTLGGTDAKVMEVTGLDSIRRLNGAFSYTKEQYVAAQQLAAQKAAESVQAKDYIVAKAAAPAVIDGKADEWLELLDDKSAVLEIREDARTRYGRVQMSYDADNLYVAWRVLKSGAVMRNAGQDYRLLFKTGDVVDLMVGPEKQTADGNGNARIVFSVLGGKPVAVLNQKTAPGAAKSESFEFASPWRSMVFDRVVLAPSVTVATGKLKAGGFLVEASIPWKLLGVEPKSGLKLKGDAGVLFGDADGTQTIARHYWSNKNTNLVNDVPGEAELTPKVWGTLELK